MFSLKENFGHRRHDSSLVPDHRRRKKNTVQDMHGRSTASPHVSFVCIDNIHRFKGLFVFLSSNK